MSRHEGPFDHSRSDAGSAYEFTECFGAQEYEEQCINLKEDFQTDEFINLEFQPQKFMEEYADSHAVAWERFPLFKFMLRLVLI